LSGTSRPAYDLDEDEHDDPLEDLATPSCTCACGPGTHGLDGCRIVSCACPAPGLRALSRPEDQDDDELAVKLAKSRAAARLRNKDPEVIKARESLKAEHAGQAEAQAEGHEPVADRGEGHSGLADVVLEGARHHRQLALDVVEGGAP
jgi:hypothetical protein